jgi:hypothetical protein
VKSHLRGMTTVVVMVSGALLLLPLATPTAAATSVTPPHDPATVGALTLCSPQGKQVRSGSLSAKPAIWRAVNSTAAPKGYANGGTATLYAFQPRPGVPPTEWSGEQLTASARYTFAAHPMAAATSIDESLATYLGDYPLMTSSKLIELRNYLAAPNAPALTTQYDATYLHVGNGTWTQLNPGPADCTTAGRAVSLETATLPRKTVTVKSSARPGQPGSAHADRSSGNSVPAASDITGTPAADASATDASGTSDTARNLAIGACVVLLAAGAIYGLRRRS